MFSPTSRISPGSLKKVELGSTFSGIADLSPIVAIQFFYMETWFFWSETSPTTEKYLVTIKSTQHCFASVFLLCTFTKWKHCYDYMETPRRNGSRQLHETRLLVIFAHNLCWGISDHFLIFVHLVFYISCLFVISISYWVILNGCIVILIFQRCSKFLRPLKSLLIPIILSITIFIR